MDSSPALKQGSTVLAGNKRAMSEHHGQTGHTDRRDVFLRAIFSGTARLPLLPLEPVSYSLIILIDIFAQPIRTYVFAARASLLWLRFQGLYLWT